ncbi:MAG TPA: energy transducer TonB [Burkholderiaceae bacterium]|jgi:colicin import membrane protein|nr:energy transducer TonB [Burkholderiaceae bacterium]
MNSSVPYSVPKEPGKWMAIVLAVLVHALLLAFLWIGINWANNKPETFEPDSVWSEHDLEKAPPPVPQVQPEPTPVPEAVKPPPVVKEEPTVDPEIALEQEKKRLKKEKEKHDAEEAKKEEAKKELAAEKQKEADDKKKLADDKRKQDEADKKLLQKQREAEIKRITAENANPNSTGVAPRSQSSQNDASWIARVTAKVKSNIIGVTIPPSSDGNDPVVFEVTLLPDGSVAGMRKTKTSGIPAFDDAVKRAIEASQPYPAEKSGRVPPSFISNNKPKDQ